MPTNSGLQYYDNGSEYQIESRYARFKNLMIENPLVAVGIVFTGAVLFNGARKMRAASATSMQRMMRWRIYGQGASLALLAYLSFKVHRVYKERLLRDSTEE